MAQFMRPISDAFNAGWQKENGNSVNLYESIDEPVQNDADYIQSDLNPADQVFVFKLSTVVDPGVNTGHIFRVTGGKDQAGGRIINVLLELRQAYVSEASPGTLIGSQLFSDIPVATPPFPPFEAEIEPAAVANITDYSDLYIRVVASTVE
jgi:hypothetical protein